MISRFTIVALGTGILLGIFSNHALCQSVSLLDRYPTQMLNGDTSPARARPWEFSSTDVFRLSNFRFQVGTELLIETGPADLGIGHCVDGAVWAVLIPRAEAKVTSKAATQPEAISHVWLRFHPKEIEHLFPPTAVSPGEATNDALQMRFIANAKFTSSWHAGMNAMIPEPNIITVDLDTGGGSRRFFSVDSKAGTPKYIDAFANRAVKSPPALSPALVEETFDQIWTTFDKDYAMFVIRPDVDWEKLRNQYRPKALGSKSAYEFAGICAEMLAHLRDLHVGLTLAGVDVPVFNRPRASNSNPTAHRGILGEVFKTGPVQWAVTSNKIGYLAINGWSDREIGAQVDKVLERMRDTRALILDVRLNGGGSEPAAIEVAGRFVPKEYIYAYHQVRNGPKHTDLTNHKPRRISPRGTWRYDRPVTLLIGQKCMSSNESFIGMMLGDPEVTTMGDRTCGSSGNPKIVHLPLEMTVNVPAWIDYLPDKQPLDERGFQPQIIFNPKPGAFEGNRDDLLTAALERLQRVPLPEKQIAEEGARQ